MDRLYSAAAATERYLTHGEEEGTYEEEAANDLERELGSSHTG
jgi:hypothetical protein